MAKELPYFKFEPNQWENGNIQICTREDKGLFMDLCSMYWSRLGDLPLKLAVQKLCNGNATAFDSLIEENIFAVIDGFICIGFLNEQLSEFKNTSKQNSKNAKEGWDKRRKNKEESKKNATASNSQNESSAIREDEIKEEKGEKKKEEPIVEKFDYKKTLLELVDDEVLVNDYISLRKLKKAPTTETAFKLLKKECDKNNFSLKSALEISIQQNWQGFKVEWIKNIEKKEKSSAQKEKEPYVTGRYTETAIKESMDNWVMPK